MGTGGKHGAVVGRARNSPRPLAGSGDNGLKEELGGRVAPGTGSSVWKPLFLGEARVWSQARRRTLKVRATAAPPPRLTSWVHALGAADFLERLREAKTRNRQVAGGHHSVAGRG